MPSFFSIRVAPGVRLSASSRGLRAHVGPRGARLHVGGGRTGVSTAAGPFRYYTSGNAGSGTRSSNPAHPSVRVAAPVGSAKELEAADIGRVLSEIQSLHRAVFDRTQKAVAESPATPPLAPIRYLAEFDALNSVSLFDRVGRRVAKERAYQAATVELNARKEVAEAVRVEEQAEIDRAWYSLMSNDPDTVLERLRLAFGDNYAPTAAVGVDDGVVSLAVLVPDAGEVIPEREVGRTTKGNLSLKKMTKTMRAQWYRQLVAGYVVVSAVEAFAVAPGLTAAAVVAFRRESGRVSPVLAVHLGLEDVAAERRNATDAWRLVESEATFNLKGRANELVTLDLSNEPDIAALTAAIEDEA